jgi:hypothetical protein
MNTNKNIRYVFIIILLLPGVYWSVASAGPSTYPRQEFLASVEWLETHMSEESLVILDVCEDKYFDGYHCT